MTERLTDDVLDEWAHRDGRHLVALDFDGTLAPIVDRPEDAALPARTREALDALIASERFEIAIVTGRSVTSVDGLLAAPNVWRVGLHGMEMCRPGGTAEVRVLADGVADRIAERHAAAARLTATIEGAWIEDKRLSLALHTRLCTPDDEREAQRHFEAAFADAGVDLIRGKRVIEARPRGVHKGVALLEVAGEVAATEIFYAGDDVTDEDAFRTLEAHPGALTVKVGEGATAARWRVEDVDSIASAIERLGGD